MVALKKDLWSIVWGKPQIDPSDLALAVLNQAQRPTLDYRTRLLIRDSIDALRNYWGAPRVQDWLRGTPVQTRLDAICQEDFERIGFPSIGERLMEKTDPETVRQYFREISVHVHRPLRIDVGGSIALIVPEHLSRATEDIDVVDEVPKDLREQHTILAKLKARYGLKLGHFQSHYLPSGWQDRLHYHDTYGNLQVYFVDVYDVFLGKSTSIRDKDRDDLRMLAPNLDKNILVERLRTSMTSTFASEELRRRAEQNWYVVFGEPLPS